jgi:hypothetical protein
VTVRDGVLFGGDSSCFFVVESRAGTVCAKVASESRVFFSVAIINFEDTLQPLKGNKRKRLVWRIN